MRAGAGAGGQRWLGRAGAGGGGAGTAVNPEPGCRAWGRPSSTPPPHPRHGVLCVACCCMCSAACVPTGPAAARGAEGAPPAPTPARAAHCMTNSMAQNRFVWNFVCLVALQALLRALELEACSLYGGGGVFVLQVGGWGGFTHNTAGALPPAAASVVVWRCRTSCAPPTPFPGVRDGAAAGRTRLTASSKKPPVPTLHRPRPAGTDARTLRCCAAGGPVGRAPEAASQQWLYVRCYVLGKAMFLHRTACNPVPATGW